MRSKMYGAADMPARMKIEVLHKGLYHELNRIEWEKPKNFTITVLRIT